VSESQVLTIEGLTKQYRAAEKPALAAVTFSAPPGALVALLGPNGAGKSTLINILAGRVDADAGDVRIAGEVLTASKPHLRRLIGIVPQEIRFDYIFTVEELLRLEVGFYGLRRDEGHLQRLLERLSLADKRHARVRNLSGGMQRRLMIARALVHRPRLLLLDEPTAGVDLHLRRDMYAFVRELNAAGTTIVLTTHYLEEAELLCERIVVLDQGRLIADASRDDFLKLAGDVLTVDIRTTAAERVLPLLVSEGGASMPVTHTADGLRVLFPGAERARLLETLSVAAPHFDSFEVSKPRLEEVFVALTTKQQPSPREGGHARLH
jgi:ABC-2 type transport system ATP-binding protein